MISVDIVPSLVQNVFNKSFYPYEFLDARHFAAAETEAALADSTTLVFEKLHLTAFRNGLGNPLYGSAEALDNLSRKDLSDYVAKYFSPERISLVGYGVAHDELKELAEEAFEGLQLSSVKAATPKTKYFGGETRIDAGPVSDSIFVVAYPGAAYTSAEYPASKVLTALLCGEEHVKWGSQAGLLAAARKESTKSTAFSTSYSDAGLVGLTVRGKDSEVKDVAKKSIEILKSVASGNIPPEALAAAKKEAVVSGESSLNRQQTLEAFAKSPSVFGLEKLDAFSKVTASQVQKVEVLTQLAQAALSAKPTVVAHGNLLKLPYADELE